MVLRPQLTVQDFDMYLQYELTLDKLREIRSKRLMEGKNKTELNQFRMVRSSFIQHIHYIYQRATRRFSQEMHIWDAHIAFLESAESFKFLDTVFGKVLSLYPKKTDYWIKAALFEVEKKHNFLGARIFLQRALRFNPRNPLLWHKYYEVEMWNILRFQERQKVLNKGENCIDSQTKASLERTLFIIFQHAAKGLLANHSVTEYLKQAAKDSKADRATAENGGENMDLDNNLENESDSNELEIEEENEDDLVEDSVPSMELQNISGENFEVIFHMHFLLLDLDSFDLFQEARDFLEEFYLNVSTQHHLLISSHLFKCHLLSKVYQAVVIPLLQEKPSTPPEFSSEMDKLSFLFEAAKEFLKERASLLFYDGKKSSKTVNSMVDILISSVLIGVQNLDARFSAEDCNENILTAWKAVVDYIKSFQPFQTTGQINYRNVLYNPTVTQVLSKKPLQVFSKRITEFYTFLKDEINAFPKPTPLSISEVLQDPQIQNLTIYKSIISSKFLVLFRLLNAKFPLLDASSILIEIGEWLSLFSSYVCEIELKCQYEMKAKISENLELLSTLTFYIYFILQAKILSAPETHKLFQIIFIDSAKVAPLLTLPVSSKALLLEVLMDYESSDFFSLSDYDRVFQNILLNVHLVTLDIRKEFLIQYFNFYYGKLEEDWNRFTIVVKWILKQFRDLPQLFQTSLCAEFFDYFLDKIDELSSKNKDKKRKQREEEKGLKDLVFLVAQNASELCPNNARYLDRLVQYYREDGNHTLANHLQFKKRRFQADI
jgi:hypothetical protein